MRWVCHATTGNGNGNGNGNGKDWADQVRFFEWDASLVRDGTYYAAMLLARGGGSDEDISICLQALNELRWAHGKCWERSNE
jgi:hypothetical protein